MISNDVLKKQVLRHFFEVEILKESYSTDKVKTLFNVQTGKKDANFGSSDGEYPFFTCAKEPIRCSSYSYDMNAIIIAGNGDIGNISIYEGKFEAYQRTYLISQKSESIYLKYAYYYFLAYWVDYNLNKMYGAVIPYIRLGNLENFEISYPRSLNKQKEIVQKIDEMFELIEIKEKNDNEKVKFKELLKEKILDKAVEGKLVENNKKESVDISKFFVDKKLEKVSEEDFLYTIPDNWVWMRLGNLCKTNDTSSFSDGPFGSNLKKEHYIQEPEVRIIQLSNIGINGWEDSNVKYTSYKHLETISRCEVFPGNIVIAKMMPAGRPLIVPDLGTKIVLGSDAVKFIPNDNLSIKYIYYAIKSKMFVKQVYSDVSGITRTRTSVGKLKTYLVPIPPLDEQKRIVEKIENLFELIEQL